MKTLYLVILIIACSVCILSNTNQANATYAIYSRVSQTVASGNAVFVTWDQSTENNTYILFKKSLDGGTTFGKTLEIASNVGVAIDQRVAISQNNTYIAWGTNMDTPHIFLRKSSDFGNTFGPALILSDPYPLCSGLHNLIATGSNVYVFFSCYNSASKEGSIVFRASHDYGNIFQNPVTIFKGNHISSGSGVSAVVNGSNIYLAFQSSDDLSHPSDVIFKSSHDGGMSFSDSLTLSNGTAWHTYPNVASFDNHVYVIWVDYDGTDFKSLLLRKSDDYGKTFGNVIRLRETAPEFGIESIPSIIASDGKVYVKWQEMNFPLDSSEQKQSVMLTTISNNGDSFDTVSDVSGKQTFDLIHSEIASANHNLYLMWPNVTNPIFDTVGIFFKKSTDGGSTFGNVIDLNKNNPFPVQMGDPHLVASENNVYVTGDSVEKSHDIFFIASHDDGATFGKMIDINDFNPTGIIVPKVESPLKQLNSGIASQNVKCPNGLELVINFQKSPACVRHVHLPRMLSHGWVYGVDDVAEVASKKIQDILVVHDKIHEGDGLVPVTVTEVINHAESLDSVMDWSFIPIGYNGDNRGITWDFIPQSYPLQSGVTDEKGNDVIDKSRMSENFGITLELRLYSAICGSTEQVRGEGGHPFSLPIKKGNPVVFVYSGGRGVLPDSSGTYTVNFVSLFETQVQVNGNWNYWTAKSLGNCPSGWTPVNNDCYLAPTLGPWTTVNLSSNQRIDLYAYQEIRQSTSSIYVEQDYRTCTGPTTDTCTGYNLLGSDTKPYGTNFSYYFPSTNTGFQGTFYGVESVVGECSPGCNSNGQVNFYPGTFGTLTYTINGNGSPFVQHSPQNQAVLPAETNNNIIWWDAIGGSYPTFTDTFEYGVPCNIPSSGVWDVQSSCVLTSNQIAPDNVIVENGVLLTVQSGVQLTIDFSHHYLKVMPGGGVLITNGGKISS